MIGQKDLYRFFKGRASGKQEKQILQWLDQDHPANLKRFMHTRKIYDLLLLSERNAQTPELREPRPALRIVATLTRAAALIALAAFIGYWVSGVRVDRLAELTNTVVVPAGQRVNITLPDGTNVWLNSLSEFSYPAAFSKGGRVVKLNGEGFFDVAHDAKNPFTIHTERYDVKVLGTKFNVFSSPDSDHFSVSVAEGSVEVSDRDDPRENVLLAMNQQAFGLDGKLTKRTVTDDDLFLWREGVLSFKRTPLEELFKRFEHTFGIKVVTQPDMLPKAEFSGKFRTSDGIFHALNLLQRDVAFHYKWDEEQNIIYIK